MAWQKQTPGRIFHGPNSRVMARKSVVGTATRYGLEGPEFEFWRGVGVRFYAAVLTGPEAHPASNTTGIGSIPGVKRQKRGFNHPPHLVPKLKKEYSYNSTPHCPFMAGSTISFLHLSVSRRNERLDFLKMNFCNCQ